MPGPCSVGSFWAAAALRAGSGSGWLYRVHCHGGQPRDGPGPCPLQGAGGEPRRGRAEEALKTDT